MRRLLCILLLLIFCIQILPIKSIGQALYNQSLQEEIPHTDDKPVDKSGKGLDLPYLHTIHSIVAESVFYMKAKHLSPHPSEKAIQADWLETFSPPPEFS